MDEKGEKTDELHSEKRKKTGRKERKEKLDIEPLGMRHEREK